MEQGNGFNQNYRSSLLLPQVEFGKALEHARQWLERPEVTQKILTINAWNEWTEGSYLEPDTVNQMGYLEAIRIVFGTA